MYNKEKDEAVVLTVALNKCLKEREKNTMENEKTSLNIKKLKKQVKRNYTYIARSHIIVLLILAGVAINLTVGDNGLFRRAQNAADTWELAEQNEQSELKNMESFINGYKYNIDIPQVEDENAGVLEEVDSNILEIRSIEDLVAFSYNVKNGNEYDGKTIRLAYNLDFNSDKSYVDSMRTDYEEYGYEGPLKIALTSGVGFEPIGIAGGNSFRGIFDGNNNAICSLYINVNSNEILVVGLFVTNYGEIRNLGLVNTNITAKGTATTVGGITGYCYDNIYNCYVTGNINVTGSSWMSIGGLCGRMEEENNNIENCYNLATITCRNTLEGYGDADISCGGILGQRYANINKCCNKGNIIIDGGDNNVVTGGICGSLRKGSLKNSYNSAKIDVNSTNAESSNVNVGGVCGEVALDAKADIENCYNSGEIIGKGVDFLIIGGIVGYQRNDTEIKNSFNAGNIKGETQDNSLYIGGILGMDDGTSISNSYNTGVLQGIGNEMNIGGIVGVKNSGNSILNCKYLVGTCDAGVGHGTSSIGITVIDSIAEFPSILSIVNGENAFKEDTKSINNGYPILQWQ